MRKIKMKNSFTLSLCLTASMMVFGQNNYTQAYYGHLQMSTTPSPGVSPFLNYTAPSVNEFYGMVGTEIPLHNIQYGNLSIPIKIAYSSKGKNAFELQSRLGQGFSLIAGGVITRKVRRLPDDNFEGLDKWDWATGKPREAFRVQNPSATNYPYAELKSGSGFCHNSSLRYDMTSVFLDGFSTDGSPSLSPTIPSGSYISQNNLSTVNGGNSSGAIKRAKYAIMATYGHIDTEPDVFTYNFGGFSGNFFFDWSGTQVVESNVSGLTIIPVWNAVDGVSDKINSFIIKTKDGLSYVFSEKEITTIQPFSKSFDFNYNLNPGTPSDLGLADTKFVKDLPYTSAWFLTEINRGDADIISFTYEDNDYTAINGLNFSKSIDTSVYSSPIYGWSSTKTEFKSKILKEINCPDMKIIFSHDPNISAPVPATTITNQFYEPIIKKYTGMVIKDISDNVLKQFQFKYKYGFQETYLDSVIQKSVLPNENKILAHHFTYHGINYLGQNQPSVFYFDPFWRLTRARDRWGYYKSTPTIITQFYPYADPIFDPDTSYSTCHGLLKEIFYPTGNKDSITYEQNRYGLDKTAGPGKRVKQIFSTDGATLLNTRTYKYSNGDFPIKQIQTRVSNFNGYTEYDSDVSEIGTFYNIAVAYQLADIENSDNSKTRKFFRDNFDELIDNSEYNISPVKFINGLVTNPIIVPPAGAFSNSIVRPALSDQSYLHGTIYNVLEYNSAGIGTNETSYSGLTDISGQYAFVNGSSNTPGIKYLKFINRGNAIVNSNFENYFSVINYRWGYKRVVRAATPSSITYHCDQNYLLNSSFNIQNRAVPIPDTIPDTITANRVWVGDTHHIPIYSCPNMTSTGGETLGYDENGNVNLFEETVGIPESPLYIDTNKYSHRAMQRFKFKYADLDAFNNQALESITNFGLLYHYDLYANEDLWYRSDIPLITSKYQNNKFLGKKINYFGLFTHTGTMPEIKYSFFTSDSLGYTNLDTLLEVKSYDKFGAPICLKKKGGPFQLQLHNYDENIHPAANSIIEGVNCTDDEIYLEYTNVLPNSSIPKIFNIFGYANSDGIAYPLSTNRSYVVDYFGYIDGTWQYVKENVTGSNMIIGTTINKTVAAYNFLRIYPKDATITTKYLHPVFGVLAEQDANGKMKIYDYDGFGRLNYIRDFKGNIINEFTYKP
jgi:hypothetical protein